MATYEVFVMGAQSGVATTSFTEGNVSIGSKGSKDNSGTKGNTTDLIAHFGLAKHVLEAQPQPIVRTEEDTARTITLSGTDEAAILDAPAPSAAHPIPKPGGGSERASRA